MSQKVTQNTPKKEILHDEEKLADLITKKNGNISAVARFLKCSRKTVHDKINESEILKTAVDDARDMVIDDAEDKLGAAVRKGEAWAVCFTLKTVGKSRGYVEKSEIQHGGEVKHNHSHSLDLSNLSDKELDLMEKLLLKANAS